MQLPLPQYCGPDPHQLNLLQQRPSLQKKFPAGLHVGSAITITITVNINITNTVTLNLYRAIFIQNPLKLFTTLLAR
ncbi:hypothetical protein, partial [Acinetobacter baumannii]|uniref:hypothetical protein n=1 Tax=Acinetobacter baumannii TaxID=470 RepID=UPI001BC87063